MLFNDDVYLFLQYHIFNGAASFYVLGKRKADLILNCDGQITSIVGDEKVCYLLLFKRLHLDLKDDSFFFQLKVVRYVAKSDVYSDEQIASIQVVLLHK